MVIAYDLRKSNAEAFVEVKRLTDEATAKGYKVIAMSASNEQQTTDLKKQYQLGF